MDNQEALRRFGAYLERRFAGRRTPIDYVCDVRQFQQACPKPWESVTLQDMDAFIDQMRADGLKPTTIKRRVAALRCYFDFLALEEGRPEHVNPLHPKRHSARLGRALPRGLADAEVVQLLAVLQGARDRALVFLMLRGGLRVAEVVGLTLDDPAFPCSPGEPLRVRVLGKGQKERYAYLSGEGAAALQDWLAVRPTGDTTALFLNERGRPLTTAGVQWLLRQYGKELSIRLTPHRLRHTFARQLVEAQMPVESVSRLLGHSQISTTQIYLEGADPDLRRTFLQSMERLEGGDGRPVPTAAPLPAPVRPSAGSAEPRYPDPPDGSAWATDLPEAVRQACLRYMQRRLSGWRASQRRESALRVLGDLARFWRWVLARRALGVVAELRPEDLQAYISDQLARGNRASSINRVLARVLGLLHELADEGEFQRLEAQTRPWLTETQPQAAREAAWFFLLAHTGLRLCELLDVRQADLDLDRRCLRVSGKGSRERIVYLTETAAQALQRYLSICPHPQQALLFVNEQGKPLNAVWVRQRLRALGEAAEVASVTPHRLRHTLATRLLNAGAPMSSLRKLLGHEHLSTTQIDARVYDETVERDYRQAMARLEQAALAEDALPVPWFAPSEPSAVPAVFVNSI